MTVCYIDSWQGRSPGSMVWGMRHGEIPKGWRVVRAEPWNDEVEIVEGPFAPPVRLYYFAEMFFRWALSIRFYLRRWLDTMPRPPRGDQR